MIQICLHLSLEAHHHKELIVLQHSVSSLEGLAPYCPSLEKFFRKMLFIKWHRKCNVRTTSKLFTMTQELRICLRKEMRHESCLCQVSVN